jgi:hypothetical protein
MYRYCGIVVATTCEIGEHDIACWCTESSVSSFTFGSFGVISPQDLNTPIQASGPDPVAVPTMDDVLQIYALTFLLDWSVGHNGTEAAGILFDACGMDPTICMAQQTRFECLCKDIASPVFLGYDTVRTALPRASLSMPVKAADPDYGPSMKEVLSIYPEVFVVDWDDIPMTAVAAQVYSACGVVDRSTCQVRKTDIVCYCTTKSSGNGFGGLQKIPEQGLNTPVHASSLDPDAVPTIDDVLRVYNGNFLLDWSAGHNGTEAAGILFDACGLDPTICMVGLTRLECLCNGFSSPVFLGYEMLRPPNVLPDKLAAVVPVWYNDWK